MTAKPKITAADARREAGQMRRIIDKSRSRPPPAALLSIREMLQSLPIDKRATIIAEIFRIAAGEFAAMVLEHVEPPRTNGAAASVSRETASQPAPKRASQPKARQTASGARKPR